MLKRNRNLYVWIGLSIPIIFWTTYGVLSSLRPEYSFKTKAISELGSVDAPHLWFWNVFGYILPGILISIYSYGLHREITGNRGNKWPLNSFIFSGLFMSLSGVFPADMDNRQSFSSLLHSVGSFGCYIFFLIGAFTYPRQMKMNPYWKTAIKPTLIFTWLTILAGSWYVIFPSMPGVGQRIVFFFYLFWFFYTALKIYYQKTTHQTIS
jgi:hypothetical membrane protein